MNQIERVAISLSKKLREVLDWHLATHKKCIAQGGGPRGMTPDEAYEDGASEFHNDLQDGRKELAKAALASLDDRYQGGLEAAAEVCIKFSKDLGDPDIDMIEYGLGYHSGMEMAACQLVGKIRALMEKDNAD